MVSLDTTRKGRTSTASHTHRNSDIPTIESVRTKFLNRHASNECVLHLTFEKERSEKDPFLS